MLAPGWTDYCQRVQYGVYDVTGLLRTGENVLGAVLGDGWAVGHIAWGPRQKYFDRPRLLAQLEVTLSDGRTVTVVSDGAWKHRFGPLLDNDLLMGEAYDARLEMPGWDVARYDDGAGIPSSCSTDPGRRSPPPTGRPCGGSRSCSRSVIPSTGAMSSGSAIFDLGQNMVGRVRLRGSAPQGTTVTLRFAETLTPSGEIYTANLRTARATDYYTFRGAGEEVWEPKFTFHGFRYVELVDYPGLPSARTPSPASCSIPTCGRPATSPVLTRC